MGRFFGTDGVRGLANRFPLDGNTAYRIAQLAAKHLLQNHKKHGRPFFVAKDTRRSGDLLEHAVAAGAASMGADGTLLSGETASGCDPVNAVKTMQAIIDAATKRPITK